MDLGLAVSMSASRDNRTSQSRVNRAKTAEWLPILPVMHKITDGVLGYARRFRERSVRLQRTTGGKPALLPVSAAPPGMF